MTSHKNQFIGRLQITVNASASDAADVDDKGEFVAWLNQMQSLGSLKGVVIQALYEKFQRDNGTVQGHASTRPAIARLDSDGESYKGGSREAADVQPEAVVSSQREVRAPVSVEKVQTPRLVSADEGEGKAGSREQVDQVLSSELPVMSAPKSSLLGGMSVMG